ncbi:ATP-binding protein [Desulfonatronum thiodismutans]|uniref:ATP-binding protein n=1 Tax=Desulfonatronum thiodismutans TaxID=159290 RepID=UPI0004ABE261|nr:ATP-binding protein [Desulfonatronum thiodismutans]
MHLSRLKIREFRNLRDFEITFTPSAKDADGLERDFKSHAVIGQNGSGKSNMIEAIVTIFRDLDLNQKTEFEYELDYWCRGHLIRVNGATGRVNVTDSNQATVTGEGSDFAISHLSRNAKKYLPNHVFAYYSGRSERIEAIFQQHQQRFYKALLDGSDELMRRLFYCRNVHSQFVLLAYLLKEDTECRRVLVDLGIEELESVLFVLKKPYWYKTDLAEEILIDGDNRFWYARGIVQTFLDQLWKESIAPIEHSENRLLDFRGRKETQDLLYLFVPDKDALGRVAEQIGEPARFFKYLESTYISDLIDEVRINVKHRDICGNLNFTQLSEGEQQLLTVLGLMRFTHEDESLFLLDEPDTHLNPIWKLRYFDEIEKVVKLQNDSAAGSSHLIITTHDPLMIGSLRKEQVRILKKDKGSISVEEPEEHPQGMGFAGLLKSELFGLRSTVDTETRRRLDHRNYLYALGDKRTTGQNAELTRLSAELSELGFASDFKDPYLEMFVKQMALRTEFHKDVLTPEEQAAQDAAASAVIDKILAERKNA